MDRFPRSLTSSIFRDHGQFGPDFRSDDALGYRPAYPMAWQRLTEALISDNDLVEGQRPAGAV